MSVPQTDIDATLDRIIAATQATPSRTKPNQWEGRCPAHDDKNPSFGVGIGADERLLLSCQRGCSTDSILRALGLTERDLFPGSVTPIIQRPRAKKGVRPAPSRETPTYLYHDEAGNVVFAIVRRKDKTFAVQHPDGKGGWLYGYRADTDRTIYRLPEVLEAIKQQRKVVIVEGEKDVDRLRSLNIVATTNPNGAGNWTDAYSERFKGAGVIVIPDEDEAGHKHAESVATSLYRAGASVQLLHLPGLEYQEKHGADVSDWLDSGHTVDELKRLIDACKPWKPADAPEIINALELARMELPEPKWIVPNILPEGLSILCAKPKLGKSWWALGTAIAVACGGVALGNIPVEKGRVLYLALEDNWRRLQDRMKAILGTETPPTDLDLVIAWKRADEGGASDLAAYLDKHPDTRLVIIDTLARIRHRANGQTGVYADDYAALEPFKTIADRYGIGILLVHHVRKATADDIYDTVSGSTGMTGAVDTTLIITREAARADGVLYVKGRDVEESELAMRFEASRASWEIMGNADDYRQTEERQAILDLLDEADRPMSPKEIAQHLDKNENTLKTTLRRMVLDGKVKRVGRGLYTPVNYVTDETM